MKAREGGWGGKYVRERGERGRAANPLARTPVAAEPCERVKHVYMTVRCTYLKYIYTYSHVYVYQRLNSTQMIDYNI